jgi:hypothetical protein
MVLHSIQCAYDDDMAILKAFETYVSIYVGSKIFVNVLGTKMVYFLWRKWDKKDLFGQA